MVGMMKTMNSRERLATCIKSVKIAADLPSRLEHLHQLKDNLLPQDLVLLSEFLPRVFELQSDRFSPIRKLVTEIIGEIGLKHRDLLPQIVPILISVTSDGTPAVARQAIMCGIYLFRYSLERTAIEGLYSCELDSSLQSLWECMLKFKEKMYAIAFQGDGGMRLLALKFVVAIILLYTPDPNGLSEPPPREGSFAEFNISWLRGGHPLLNIGDLSIEASQSLGLLLDQLRLPAVQIANNSLIIVLIKSLSEIAEKRPAFYGRILPVLLDMDPSVTAHNGAHALGVNHALKNAFFRCLKCTHSSATPWHSRLNVALREMNTVGLAEVCKINGNGEGQDGVAVPKDEKLIIKECDVGRSKIGRKRPGEESLKDPDELVDEYRKRMRPTPSVSEESNIESDKNIYLLQDNKPLIGPTSSRSDSDISGPVQQLVAMFGALVGQGEKAIGSLQILIASISADLLAEVVIANMCYLPPSRPDEGDGELLQNMNVVGSDAHVKYPSSFVADVLSLSSSFPAIASMLDAAPSMSFDMKTEGKKDIVLAAVDHSVVSSELNHVSENAERPCHLAASLSESDPTSDISKSKSDNVRAGISFDILDMGNLESEIPGLVSPVHNDRLSEIPGMSLTSNNSEDGNLENDLRLGQGSSLIMPLSISAQRSEEFSPGASVSDLIISAPSAATSMPAQLILPKMSAPVIVLADEQKDHLQRLAFIRIVDAYKQIVVAGGLEVRSSVLAYLGVEYPLELEPWKVLQRHILADHITHEGHELTLRVLYRLFGVAEVENDFFSSTTAASVYETFFLTVAEALRDSLPPSDKSLSRLLGDAPYLPKAILDLLESMCSPGNDEVVDKEFQNGDRVTQGLSAVWNLILSRPSIRDVCLKIALKSAVHHSEEVRMKAIRLVANKLYPLTSIAQKIEKFSEEMVLSVTFNNTIEVADSEKSLPGSLKDSDLGKPSNEPPSTCSQIKDISSDAHQLSLSPTVSPLPISEAQRRMSLFFALCTKKHSLFRQIFVLYKCTSATVKETIHHHIPILVRTMGLSSDLLEIIADPPTGSKDLLIQVLHTLTDGTIPSHELVSTLRKLYSSKLKDVDIIIPVLPFLPKDEVMMLFPQIVNLAGNNFQTALTRVLQGSNHNGPALSPAEVLIAIHGIDPDRDGIPLKKVTDACNACFEQRQIFTQQVIAKVLNQLVEQIPLPLLFMRTVLQAIGAFPPLVDFILDILSRLVSKQIWKYPKLWVGFLKCAQLTKPRSFSVLLQLPSMQLENALNKTPALKPSLAAHANQPEVRSSLPRSVLAVLGIGVDSQTTSQSQVGDTSNSEEAITEKSKDSSIVS